MSLPPKTLDGALPPQRADSVIKTRARAEGGGKKRHSYKPLPTHFRCGGFDYRQIAREGDVAIYEQTWEGNERSAAFEVIRIRRREGVQVAERFIEPAETYPKAEAWGIDGLTLTDKDAAFAKLREIAGQSLNIARVAAS